jgi:hypothetical protein
MAHENPTRGEELIVAELLLKLGIRVSRRTVRRDMPDDKGNERRKEQSDHGRGTLTTILDKFNEI